MSLKRKLDISNELSLSEKETNLPSDDSPEDYDADLSDFDFQDDIEDDFDKLMLNSEGITDDEGNLSEEENEDENKSIEEWGRAGQDDSNVTKDGDDNDDEYSDIGDWEEDNDEEESQHTGNNINEDNSSIDVSKIPLQDLIRNIRSIDSPRDDDTLKNKVSEKYSVVKKNDKKTRRRFLEQLDIPKQIMRELQMISYKDPKRRARVLKKIKKGYQNKTEEQINRDQSVKGKKTGKISEIKGKKTGKISEITTKSPKSSKRKSKYEDKITTENEVETEEHDAEDDEYEDDSSDEEDLRNTIGNIPINWYDEYPHLGYGLDSLPIMKPDSGDTLDKFLDKLENPDYYRTVFDKQTGKEVKLSDNQLDLVHRLLGRKVPNRYHKMYTPFPDLYSHDVMKMPLSGRPEHKRSFIPSKPERKEVLRVARLISKGIHLGRRTYKKKSPRYFDIWKPRSEAAPRIRGVTEHIAAPKERLPGHGQSYNPPPEYLLSKTDQQRLSGKPNNLKEGGALFKSFWRKYKSIREVPIPSSTVKWRFNRLLDLYLCPRKKYKKVTAKAKDFLPEMPDKKDLRPYPTMPEIVFTGHESIIRTISIHPNGKYLASGSDDHTVRIWEVTTGRCLRTFTVEEAVKSVAWNPNPRLFLLGIAMGRMTVLLNPETYLTDKIVVQQTNAIFKDKVDQGDFMTCERIERAVTWRLATEEEYSKGYRLILDHFKEVTQVAWHRQGDYFATLVPEGQHRSVIMHQLSRWRSQLPFKRNKGRIQSMVFHPKKPLLFVCTQSHIRVYDLQRQNLLKKVQANSRYISAIAVHPGGENFIIGGFDRRVNWFEMECTKRPHLMRYHAAAVRSIKFHRKYPLFASTSDDGYTVVTHATVYDDWSTDPTIVPLKRLRGHRKFDDYYALDLAWHPYEPYLFTAGADATIKLWR